MTVPLWVTLVVAIGSPLLTFGGVLLTLSLNRVTARETDRRWQREETMRLLRWAVERTVVADQRQVDIGLVTLRALSTSSMLQAPDEALVGAVLRETLSAADDDLD